MSGPRLVSVDVTARPPMMTLVFPGWPCHYITVRMRTDVQSAGLARAAAQAEIHAFCPRDVELLRESATPGPDLDVGDPALLEANVRPVQRVVTFAGVVHCPACRYRIGRTDNPALGYFTKCNGCQRRIGISFAEGAIVVMVRDAQD